VDAENPLVSNKIKNPFERPDLDNDKLLTLVRNIQQKLAFIEQKGGYTSAHEQMRRQLSFLVLELNERTEKTIDELTLNEKPFILTDDERK